MNNLGFGEIEKFNVLVENKQGTKTKYEYDEVAGILRLDFVFSDGLVWPYNYGEILGTLGGDGDKLDAMILSTEPIDPGIVVSCRAIGTVEILDRGEEDNKIICVPVVDRGMEKVLDLNDLGEEWKKIPTEFYLEIARQKNKTMEIKGFWGKEKTEEYIRKTVV